MMKNLNMFSKHKWIFLVIVGVVVLFFGSFAFNVLWHGVWAFPLDYRLIAEVKLTNHDTNEVGYYTIYANGDKAREQDGDGSDYEANIVEHFDQQFTPVSIVSITCGRIEDDFCQHYDYVDSSGNQYEWLPSISDPDLLVIESDFFAKVETLSYVNYRVFRDGNMLFVATLCDCGFGTSSRKLYAYDMLSRRLRYIGSFPTEYEVDWIYGL